MVRAVIAIVVLIGSRHAAAEDARVTSARSAYDAGRQEITLQLLAPVLAGSLDDHARAAALRLAGCAEMVLGHRTEAIARFKESFALEPEAALEPKLASSPDARGLLEVARGQWREALVLEMDTHAAELAKMKLSVHAPARVRGGQPFAIAVAIDDPGALVARAELSYRRRGQGEFTLMTARLEKPVPLTFSIPAEVTESPHDFVLEYHVTLRHRTGFDLRRDGDADHPRAIEVEAGHIPRWYESWWFRGAVAVAVAGVGAAGLIAYEAHDVGPQHVVVK